MLTNHFPALSVRLSAQIEVRVDYHTTTLLLDVTQKKKTAQFLARKSDPQRDGAGTT